MKVLIIDRHPIYVLGLKQYLQILFNCEADIKTCPISEKVDFDLLENFDIIILNLDQFSEHFGKKLDYLCKSNQKLKPIGLVNNDYMEYLMKIDHLIFNALVVSDLMIEELRTIFNLLNENKKYYSPEIISFIHKNKVQNLKQIDYERN